MLLRNCQFKFSIFFDSLLFHSRLKFLKSLAKCKVDVALDFRFAPNSANFLLSCSWDATLRLYDVSANTLRVKFPCPSPLLDCTFQVRIKIPCPFSRFPHLFPNFQDPIHVWSGGLDATLRTADINSSTETVVGNHDNAIR